MLGRRVIFINFRRIPLVNYTIALVGAFFLIWFIMLMIFEHSFRPVIRQLAEARARIAATEAVNQAIKSKIINVDYSDLINVQKDNSGHIVLMQPNIVRINQLAASTTLAVQQSLKDNTCLHFYIPFGQVLGSQLLANWGPHIGVSVYPVGTVQTRVFDRFEDAGINQTRHQLYLDIQSRVKVVVPLTNTDVTVDAQVPITDTVIVGQVPSTYLRLSPGGSQ